MNKNLIIRVFPEIREEGSLYNYQIQPLSYTPDNLSPYNSHNFIEHLEDNGPSIEELQTLIPNIKILDVVLDKEEETEPLFDITIEDPGFLHSHIKDIMLEGLKKTEMLKNSFDTPEIDDCTENNIDMYVDVTKEYISVIECD